MKTLSRRLTALVLTAALCFSLAACSFGGGGKENEDPKVGEATTFVKIDITPSIELTLDENGLVASVYGANDDGVILLYGEEENLLGKDYETAAAYITDLAAELGIEDTTVFENSEGKVTVESVVDYVEKFLDEHELSDKVEDRVEELLDEAEDAAEMAALASDTYAADLAALKTQIEVIVTTVNSTATPVLPFLSADAKAELEACLEDLNSTVVNIGTMMEGGLTEEELEAAEELKRQAEETVTRLTSEFSQRLTAAETEAKAEIERRRAERSATADDVTK